MNIVTMPLAAPASLGIVGTALATAGITASTQIGIEAIAAPFKERVEAARLHPSMERLSDFQLAEIRGSARSLDQEAAVAFASLRAEADSLASRRAAIEARAPHRDALRTEVEHLRTDLAAAEQRLASARTPTDPGTVARLSAIEQDLAGEGLPAARRAELEAERTSITETLAATAPGDARAIASLAAETKGLRTALARKEKALAQAEETDARARAKLDKADTDLPRRITAGEQRAAGRREAVPTEMRRTIARLAQDGYGVRLSQDEAAQIAGRVLEAEDGEADQVLRSVTEDLVDRAFARRRAEPSSPPAPRRPDPVGEQRARVGHWTEQMRKRVQGLAREVGYEMPREEAATVAAAVTRADNDDEALAILDEVMLRPRTVAEFLPGTFAAQRALADGRAGGRTESPSGLQAGSHSSPASPDGARVGDTTVRPDGLQADTSSTSRADGTIVAARSNAQPEQLAALASELTPTKILAARASDETESAVLHDLDKLRATRDLQMPVGERLDEAGQRVADMRSVDDLMDEADARIAAAVEIRACAMPMPEVLP